MYHQILKMMFVKFITLSLLVTFINSANEKKKEFVPTHEWQIVQPGQHLPRGLHIRHNFETKETTAKLLDENEKSHSISVFHAQEATTLPPLSSGDEIHEQEEIPPKKYKSYKELTEDLEELNLSIKLDLEVINELFERFNKVKNDSDQNFEEIVNVLVDLEYCVHQYDNAQYFADKYGMEKIILPTLNFVNPELQTLGLMVLGAAVQNNPKVQIAIYESDGVLTLINLLKETNKSIVNTVISTITKLLRRFPSAQWLFIKKHGLQGIQNLTENEEIFNDDHFKYRVIILLTDIVSDSKELYIDSEGRKNTHADAINEYLYNFFETHGWCRLIKRFLFNANITSAEVMDQIFVLILTTKDKCWGIYNDRDFRKKIESVVEYYEDFARGELINQKDVNDVGYLFEFFDNLRNLSSVIYETGKFVKRDEL